MEKIILVKYSELNTKKGNQRFFIRKLEGNINSQLKNLGTFSTSANDSRLVIKGFFADINKVITKLKMTPGIENFTITKIVQQNNLESIKKTILTILPKLNKKTFRINVIRANKLFPILSIELAKKLGDFVIKNSELNVNLDDPDHIISVEIRDKDIFVYSEKLKGLGGLPVGSSGKVILLLSGGIDSPVAAFELLKRGCQVELLHFASPPTTTNQALEKVKLLAKKLSNYSSIIKLQIVNFTEIQNEIYCGAEEKYRITLMRKLFYIIASKIANKNKCKAIATGESLGQVASQTLESMYATTSGIKNLFLRPLISMNKNEIINIAKKIGTYNISISEGDDCCRLFVPKKPITQPDNSNVIDQLENLMVGEMIEKVFKNYKTLIYQNGE